MNQHTKEALKEMARVFVLAALPALIIQLQNNTLDLRALLLVGVIAVLKGLDRWIHENPNIKSSGLLPF